MTAMTSLYADDRGMGPLIRSFVSHLEVRCEAMRLAIGNRDHQALRRLAHQLKGAAGLYGFLPVSDAAGMLQAAIDSRADARSIATHVNRIAALCAQARAPSSELEEAV